MLSEVRATVKVGAREPRSPLRAPVAAGLGRTWRRLRVAVIDALSGPGLGGGGIDESAFPSGFIVPYAKGSRQVRNLWHLPF